MQETYAAQLQQLRSWKARREIENLMGRRFHCVMMKDSEGERALWCRQAPEPVLGFNHGLYRGYAALEGWFQARKAQDLSRAEVAQKQYPALAGKPAGALLGVGSLELDPLTTPVIEVAADGQTAKGFWYVIGMDTEIGSGGADGAWRRGPMYGDFVLEDGVWKIWHLLIYTDIFCRPGTNWGAGPISDFAPVEAALPAPTEAGPGYCAFGAGWMQGQMPPLPEPYETFADTFAYDGKEGRS